MPDGPLRATISPGLTSKFKFLKTVIFALFWLNKVNDLLKKHIINLKQEETEFDTILKFGYFDQIKNEDSKVSSFLTIQEGCDKFCHFCVVPFTRGPAYSRPFDKVISEAEQLIKNGVKEITLLGQNVNAYSYLENSKEYRLSNLINSLNQYSELERIRYTTSHPRDITFIIESGNVFY